jgi:hypothetical protein
MEGLEVLLAAWRVHATTPERCRKSRKMAKMARHRKSELKNRRSAINRKDSVRPRQFVTAKLTEMADSGSTSGFRRPTNGNNQV